jgi:hypothetical protein
VARQHHGPKGLINYFLLDLIIFAVWPVLGLQDPRRKAENRILSTSGILKTGIEMWWLRFQLPLSWIDDN